LTAAALQRRNALAYRSPVGDLVFDRDPRGVAQAATLNGQRLARRDFGAEVQAQIRAGVHADPARVRAAALAATPPIETTPHRAAELVDLATIDPGIRFDIRYATSNNFMGFPLYERAGAYLQRPAAEAVGRAHRALAAQGLGLLIHDAYRPWFVTKMFWEATPPDARVFVADPAEGSRHNRGCAVDLTLYDLRTGAPVEMTGRYDEMSQRSYAGYVGGTSRQRWLRDLLRREMERQGFAVYPQEWWHFDYRDWAQYSIGAATFTELAAGRT
jgi:D-alanyl-D-alanine dipeptidase